MEGVAAAAASEKQNFPSQTLERKKKSGKQTS
jgi:hypothetical protein